MRLSNHGLSMDSVPKHRSREQNAPSIKPRTLFIDKITQARA